MDRAVNVGAMAWQGVHQEAWKERINSGVEVRARVREGGEVIDRGVGGILMGLGNRRGGRWGECVDGGWIRCGGVVVCSDDVLAWLLWLIAGWLAGWGGRYEGVGWKVCGDDVSGWMDWCVLENGWIALFEGRYSGVRLD